jgi:hypothetical protein
VKSTDEMTVAKNAWVLWKILADLEKHLWNLYCDEFLDFDEEERMVSSAETS